MSYSLPPLLDAFLVQCQRRSEQCLRAQLNRDLPAEKLGLALAYTCLDGGKRLRPVLSYGSAQAVGAEMAAADAAATAVELIHCYSLVHDDLPAMDDDDLRRGKPTVHKAFDEATAVLVGDGLQAMAFRLLAEPNAALQASAQLRMVEILGTAAGDMVSGQSLDFEAVGNALDAAALTAMHKLKTGALIRASVLLGGLCNPAITADELDSLGEYADCVGLSFQIQDDILDEVADTATLGKPQGSDRDSNKPTYVSLMGLEATQTRAAELSQQAIAALAAFDERAEPLRQLATYIVSRGH